MCNKIKLGNINGYPLDEQQYKAATTEAKYSIILAGAGSGKSTTIIGKIIYLLNFKKINPKDILCISFTNEAANNLRKNIINNCGKEIEVLTFHKLALKILKDNRQNFLLAPPNYLNFVINEFFMSENNFIAISNSITFLKNKYYLKNWSQYLKITKTKEFLGFINLINKFINIYYSKNISCSKLETLFANSKQMDEKAFLKLIISLSHIYECEKRAQGFIDFNDMIYKATKIINNGGKINKYKFIIIDEFQDTSEIRFNLIRAILQQTDAALTVVGDDFQSIYRFSGCNLDLFLNFKNEFENTTILKIENTYRNSQELINVAGKFVTKNPLQMKKNLKSKKHFERPIKIIYENKSTLKNILLKLNSSAYKSILLLGRNNYDIKKYLDKDFKIDQEGFIYIKDCNKNIRFLTVHKSKGLEADVVIILNLVDSSYGFPNQFEEHKIINLINNFDAFPHEEERRLFYVALTRTKNEVYLLTKKQCPSVFVKELLKYYRKNIEIVK